MEREVGPERVIGRHADTVDGTVCGGPVAYYATTVNGIRYCQKCGMSSHADWRGGGCRAPSYTGEET